MATAKLAVAKASFSAVLLRPDPTSCPRDDIEHFHQLLSSAIARCSPGNVQKCKQWAARFLLPSPARAAALGKYLAALSGSLTDEDAKPPPQSGLAAPSLPLKPDRRGGPSAKRRRLHILYLLSDILYHAKFRDHNLEFVARFEPVLLDLFRSAASFRNAPKQIKKVKDLLDLWEENRYFAPDLFASLRKVVGEAPSSQDTDQNDAAEKSTGRPKEAPWAMPAMHGDPSTPWYDLPAANWLPSIEPNSTRPMNPSMIKPLQLAPGPADKALVEGVKKLLADVNRLYSQEPSPDSDPFIDIDQMGERVEIDEITGEILDGDTYYGWSRAFCRKMKARRRKGEGGDAVSQGRGDRRSNLSRSSSRRSRSPDRDRPSMSRSRSRSRSRSLSRPALKRPRLSPSRSPSHHTGGRSRRRSPSRSRSRSRSRSPPRSYGTYRRHSRSPSRDRSHYKGASPPSRMRDRDPHPSRDTYVPGREMSRSPQYSPPPARPPAPPLPPSLPHSYNNNAPAAPGGFHPPPGPPVFQHQQMPQHQLSYPPMPPQMPQQPYGGFPQHASPPPLIPPLPPSYGGQWPPPPPPVPMGGAPGTWGAPAAPPPQGGWSGGWGNPSPPPPPPPPLGHPHQGGGGGGGQYGRRNDYGGQGRGWGGGGRGGRGGYDRGRGW